MTEINISTYIKIMMGGLAEDTNQERAGHLMIDAVATLDNVQVDVTPKMISNLIKRKSDVHEAIKQAAGQTTTITEVMKYFEDNVIPKLNVQTSDDALERLMDCLENDKKVGKRTKNRLRKLFEDDLVTQFLVNTLLYALSQDNKLVDKTPSADDAPLLLEVSHKCPLCCKSLLQTKKGEKIKHYDVVYIYPEHGTTLQDFQGTTPPNDLDSLNNKILLCHAHGASYNQHPTKEEYEKLMDLKKRLLDQQCLDEQLEGMGLEEDVLIVITGLKDATNVGNFPELSLNALKVEEKIDKKYHILRTNVSGHVQKYYGFIKNLFSEMDRSNTNTFEVIASEIRSTFLKLEQNDIEQDELVSKLALWINNKAQLDDKYLSASTILVSFFIQNCEVFNAITE